MGLFLKNRTNFRGKPELDSTEKLCYLNCTRTLNTVNKEVSR